MPKQNSNTTNSCIFCRIAKNESPAFKILEDDEHVAFLDVFPLIKGQAVVTTKAHHPSYPFDMPDDVLSKLMLFAKRAGKAIDRGLGSERCMVMMQGYTVDHVHVKLFPVMKVNSTTVDAETYSSLKPLLDKGWYSGFILSMAGRERASDAELGDLAAKIKS